jgi:hypothetical protein
MAETEKIIFTDASGKKIYIPVTHTDVIQYKDGILTSYLDNISTMSDISYLMAYTAYSNVSIAYNISKTSYNKVENLLKTDILAGNRYIGMKLISRIYDDGTGKLKADLIDNSAAWIKYDDTRSLIDEITYLNNKINNVQINNIESGNGININTNTGAASSWPTKTVTVHKKTRKNWDPSAGHIPVNAPTLPAPKDTPTVTEQVLEKKRVDLADPTSQPNMDKSHADLLSSLLNNMTRLAEIMETVKDSTDRVANNTDPVVNT